MRQDNYDLYMTKRSSVYGLWAVPLNLGASINIYPADGGPLFRAEGQILWFRYERPGMGGLDLWQVPIEPGVDFTGGGWVSMSDLLQLIESWVRINHSWISV